MKTKSKSLTQMAKHIILSRLPAGYDGKKQRMEVMPFSKDIHDAPGIYLQKVEGCGYDVFELTPEEARALAALLEQAAKETQEEFS